MNFSGKTAVVTGGGSGIGKATALAFAKCGARVFVLDINSDLGGTVAAQSSSIGFLRVDVSDKDAMYALGRHVSSVSQVDFLVSNAGIEYNDVGNMLTLDDDKLNRILDVNLKGAIYTARAFVPFMRTGGRVVFVSSLQASMVSKPGTSYQASKAGLLGAAKALAVELAEKGINVNVVSPAAVATEGMGAVRAGDGGLDRYRQLCPLGRRAHPHEVAEPILFLCSPGASYITGQELKIDGGISAVGEFRPEPRSERVPNDPDE